MFRFCPILATLALALLAALLIACGSSGNNNSFRLLTSIAVTPAQADAQSFPNGLVTFTATGSFSLPPSPAPVTFTAPYTGQFLVDNVSNVVVANVVSTGTGTVTVQCVSGITGTVNVVASAASNNVNGVILTGSSQLMCL